MASPVQKSNLGYVDDSSLLVKLKEGDRAAFDVLYNRYWKLVFNAAFKRTSDREIAEDIAQDVFVQLWTSKKSHEIESLPSYLLVAARNGVFRRLGKEGKYTEFSEDLHDMESPVDATDSKLLHKEFLTAFAELIETLPEQQRVIFKYRFNEGLNSDQIAEKLNISPKTVRNHIGRALNTLKKELLWLHTLAILHYL